MYYEKNPTVAHDIHEIHVNLLDTPMSFMTDAGVFSKKMVDYGSQVLLKTLHFEKGASVLDVGCGYGPIGLTLAKVFSTKTTLIDINSRALDLATKMLRGMVLPLKFINPISTKTWTKHSIILFQIHLFGPENRLYMK